MKRYFDFVHPKRVFLIVALVGTSLILHAQPVPSDYKDGLQRVESGDYQGAMEALRVFMDRQQYGALADYARFHFARAAYGNGQYELAKTTLTPLMESSRSPQKDEAHYLTGLSLFRQNRFSDALAQIDQIRRNDVRAEAHRASYAFLKEVPTSVLMVQMNQHEDNLGLVFALREKLIAQTSLSSQENEVLQKIKNVTLPDTDEEVEENQTARREVNQTLEIAVVLPFNYNGGTGVHNLGAGNFVFELYRGILFGIEQARSKGHRVEVKTFDTERNPARITGILQDPFFQRADVIIGPIYPEEVQLMSELASSRQIPFINPLSNIEESLKDVDQAYLFRPSAEAIATSVNRYLSRFSGKRVAVAYAATSRDELLVRRFSEQARSSGIQVVASQRVTGRDMRDFLDRVFGGAADILVIFADDPNIAAPTFSLVESQSVSMPVVVMDSWLYFNFASYEMMESQDFHFVGNNMVNLSAETTDKVKEAYFERFKVYPGLNAFLGYELTHWLTNVLNANRGFDFRRNLQAAGFQPGEVSFGFDFSRSSHNAYVPILRLEAGELIIE